MTTDITIGKLKRKSFDEVLRLKLENDYNMSYEDTFCITDFIEVEQCPDEEDGCSEEDTYCPNTAYRSGSSIAINDSFKQTIPEAWEIIRTIKSNDFQVTRLKPLQDRINKAEYNGDEHCIKMRLHWIKFWMNKAIKLYGDDAVISLS